MSSTENTKPECNIFLSQFINKARYKHEMNKILECLNYSYRATPLGQWCKTSK